MCEDGAPAERAAERTERCVVRHHRHLLTVGAALMLLTLVRLLSVGADATPQPSIPVTVTTVATAPVPTTRVTTSAKSGSHWGVWLLILFIPTVLIVGGLLFALQARREYLATMARKAASPPDDEYT